MRYKVAKDRQNSEDFMVGTVGDYKFWLDWINENTINSNALKEDKEKMLEYYKALNEKELIKFIDDTYEITIVEVEND